MKKFNIKTILLLMLVLVLAFSLVACNNQGDEGNDDGGNGGGGDGGGGGDVVGEFTPAEYFTDLWDLTKDIGNETIAENDNIALHADLQVAIKLNDVVIGDTKHSLDVGIALDVVLDRTSKDSSGSALRAELYDPSTQETFFAAYFFFNDPSAIYLDFAGQHVKVEFDYLNDTYADSFHNLVFNDAIMGDKTINDMVTALTANMGDHWDLDALISSVISLFNIDLNDPELLSTINGIGSMILPQGVSLIENGKLNIKSILTSETASLLFTNSTSKTANGVTTNVTTIDSQMLSLAGGALGSMVPGLDQILTNASVGLEYAYAENEMKYFTIFANLMNITGKDSQSSAMLYPAIEISIVDFELTKAGANDIAIDKTAYSTDLVFDASIDLNLKGVKVDLKPLFGEDAPVFDLSDENVRLGLKARLDLKNRENNNTAVNLYLALGDKHAFDLSYVGGALGLMVDHTAEIGGVALSDVFGPVLEGFNGVVVDGLNIVDGFQGLVDMVINMLFPQSADVAAKPTDDVMTKVLDTINKVMPYISTEGDKLTIGGNDLFAVGINVARQFIQELYDATKTNEKANGIDFIIDKIVEADTSNAMETVLDVLIIDEDNQDITTEEFFHALFDNVNGSISLDLGDNGLDIDLNVKTGDVEVGVALGATVTDDNGLVNVADVYDNATDKTGWIYLDSSNLSIDERIDISLAGLTLDLSAVMPDGPVYTFTDEVLSIGVVGKFDEDLKANVYIALNNVHVVDVTYANNAIGIQLNREAKLGDLAILDNLVANFGPMLKEFLTPVDTDSQELTAIKEAVKPVIDQILNADYNAFQEGFNGVVLDNIDLVQMVLDFIMGGAAPAAEGEPSLLVKIFNAINKVVALIKNVDGAIVLSTDDVAGVVIDIARDFVPELAEATQAPATQTADGIAWFVDWLVGVDTGRYGALVGKLLPLSDLTVDGMTVSADEITAYKTANPDTTLTDDDITAELKLEKFERAYLTRIFTGAELNLGYVINEDGASISVSVVVDGDVELGVSVHSALTKVEDADLLDVAATYKAAQDKAGWVYVDLAPEVAE